MALHVSSLSILFEPILFEPKFKLWWLNLLYHISYDAINLSFFYFKT